MTKLTSLQLRILETVEKEAESIHREVSGSSTSQPWSEKSERTKDGYRRVAARGLGLKL